MHVRHIVAEGSDVGGQTAFCEFFYIAAEPLELWILVSMPVR